MQSLHQDIEQLEEARRQLDKGSQTGARLAIFLIDNLAELFMYWFILWELGPNPFPVKPDKYSPEKRRKILEHFKDKVSFLSTDIGIITDDDAWIIKFGHHIRNEAYHRGVLRDKILLPLAQIYFECLCSLMAKLCTPHYMISSGHDDKQVLNKFGIAYQPITAQVIANITNIVRGRRCISSAVFFKVLSEDITSRIKAIHDDISFLRTHPTDKNNSIDEVLISCQNLNDCEILQMSMDLRIMKLSKKPPPTVVAHKLGKWEAEAEKLPKGGSVGQVLKRYWEIDVKLFPAEYFVREKAELLSYYYDMQTDAYIEEQRLKKCNGYEG